MGEVALFCTQALHWKPQTLFARKTRNTDGAAFPSTLWQLCSSCSSAPQRMQMSRPTPARGSAGQQVSEHNCPAIQTKGDREVLSCGSIDTAGRRNGSRPPIQAAGCCAGAHPSCPAMQAGLSLSCRQPPPSQELPLPLMKEEGRAGGK